MILQNLSAGIALNSPATLFISKALCSIVNTRNKEFNKLAVNSMMVSFFD